MSLTDTGVPSPALNFRHSAAREWDELDPRIQTRLKMVALVGVVAIGYHFSLLSLLQTVTLDTPLAYIGLVPIIAAGLAWLNRHPRAFEPNIHDRQLDYTIGVSLLVAVVAGGLILPSRMGDMYWVERIDLLLLPVFVAGATILLFGLRVAWRQKVAIGYLFLGWPWVYTKVLLGTLGGFTSLTLSGVNKLLGIVRVARIVSGNTGLYEVVHDGRPFAISVVTACSGVDGIVGFFLIGVALASIVSGSILRKALWLATGLVLLWITNLARLLGIFWIGEKAGENIALNVVHPVAGLVMFCVGVGIMGSLLRPFGLNRTDPASDMKRPVASIGNAAPKVFAVMAILLVSALALGIANSDLKSYDLVASATGEPKLGSFLSDPAEPPGWTATYEAQYPQSEALFGSDSRWFRYLYLLTSPKATGLHSTLPVTADIIDAGSLTGFNAYGVTACYSFHGYTLKNVSNVALGEGIEGQTLSFGGISASQNWSIVYWILPVETGTGTRFERVILYLQNTSSSSVSVSRDDNGGVSLVSALKGEDQVQQRLTTDQTFLIDFARQMISGQAHQQDTGEFISSAQADNGLASLFASKYKSGKAVVGKQVGPVSVAEAHALMMQHIKKYLVKTATTTPMGKSG